MRVDIELAGFVMTAEEWDELDQTQRAQLIAVTGAETSARIHAVAPDAASDALPPTRS